MLRFALLFCPLFLLTLPELLAQRNLPVHWLTHEGVIDSSYLVFLPTVIRAADVLRFRDINDEGKLRKHAKNKLDLKDVQWLVCAGDTVVRSVNHGGRTYIGQLLYSGGVSAYRTVGDAERPYFFRYREQLIFPVKGAGRSVIDQLPITGCATLRPVKNTRTDAGVTDLARQLDNCLAGRDARFEEPLKWRMSFGVDLAHWERRIGFPRRVPSWNKVFVMPRTALTLEYAAFRSKPGIITQLQARWLHFRRVDTQKNIMGAPYREIFRIDNLYLYPGVGMRFAKSRFFEPYLTLGAAVALPVYFHRHVEFTDPARTAPGLPNRQTLRRGQRLGLGYFINYGLRIKFHPRTSFALNWRTEFLPQSLRANAGQPISTDLFPRPRAYSDLTNPLLNTLQVQLGYAW